MALATLKRLLPSLETSRLPWAVVASLVLVAQLFAIAAPCPVDPAWKRLAAERVQLAPPPCPGHAEQHAEHVQPRAFMVFHCPCGCGDAPPPATGVNYSRVGLLSSESVPAEVQPGVAPASEPRPLAPQREPSGLRHVPRAA